MMDTIVLLSGGMDSTTLVYSLVAEGVQPVCLTFHYGQRHAIKEIAAARRTCHKLDLIQRVFDLGPLKDLMHGGSLTGGEAVPDGHYAAENMASTVVPNRNAVLLALAYAYAVSRKAYTICMAAHTGDHTVYSDCRPAFMQAFWEMERLAIDKKIYGMDAPVLDTPFVHKSKAEIAVIGEAVGVPWEDTWSCYRGGDRHCGRCGTCVERIEAFKLAGVVDPTTYEDPAFAEGVL